jgi:uncharacterized membrane protein
MRDILGMPLMIFRRYYRTLWLRVTLYALLSLAVALAGPILGSWLEFRIGRFVGPDDVRPILTILASSMLAVSTFSLNIMVSSHRAAAQTATPRVHRLLLEDTTTQSVLAVFIGAFVYALSTLILVQFVSFPESAAVVTMIVTVAVAVGVVVAMLRWIEHLSGLGSLDDSLELVSRRCAEGLALLAKDPAMGANSIEPETVLPADLTPVPASASGFVQLVDVAGLESCLGETSHLYVSRGPGRHVLKGNAVAQVSGYAPQEMLNELADCFVIGTHRTYEQDPAYGLIVLSEIASKALSPGVNDPGTAIQTIGWLQRLLWNYAGADRPEPELHHPRVFVPVTDASRLVDSAFGAIARDGASTIEVAFQLRQALLRLAVSPDPALNDALAEMADYALKHSETALVLDSDVVRLKSADA